MQFLNEDKRRFSDLTDEEKGLLLLAWHKGLQIQYWVADDNEWNDESHIEDCTFNPFLDGEQYAYRIKPEPVKQVHWCNDYEDGPVDVWHYSRAAADWGAGESRIAVIRREIVDGVVSYYREDV
jgi:hypothetical protein